FKYFAGSGCGLENFFIGFTIALTVLSTALAICNFASEKGGILPASVVACYAWWLCYTALSSDPSTCNQANSNSEAQLIIGLAIGAASITYSAWSVSTSASFGAGAQSPTAADDLEKGDDKDKSKEKDSKAAKEGDAKEAQVPEPPKGIEKMEVEPDLSEE